MSTNNTNNRNNNKRPNKSRNTNNNNNNNNNKNSNRQNYRSNAGQNNNKKDKPTKEKQDKPDNAAQRKKKHRNLNIEILNKAEDMSNVKTPRLLPVIDFAAHHMSELKYLEETLIANQAPPDGRPNLLPNRGRGFIDTKGRRVFQTLPRHLRRRSASHNLYRIPLRLRHKARMEVLKSEGSKKKDNNAIVNKKPHRRHKRRPKYLRMDYLRRQNSTGLRWLETHIWARKRMHLEALWGYYLVNSII